MDRSVFLEAAKSYVRAKRAIEDININSKVNHGLEIQEIRNQTLEHAERTILAWQDFLVYFNRTFKKLHLATRGNSSQRWFDEITNVRRKDALLNYLLHARNALEHGADGVDVVKISDEPYHFNFEKNGKIFKKISYFPYWCIVKEVEDRGKKYPPPTLHLGQPVDQATVSHIANLGMAFLEEKMVEAKTLVEDP